MEGKNSGEVLPISEQVKSGLYKPLFILVGGTNENI